jgi:hypothetical protein
VHDRRIDDETYVFGNHGALWMNAMTWYDHSTYSIWSQPWGRALTGDLEGTQLQLIPFSLVPWGTWRAEHPNTLALKNEGYAPPETVTDEFVVGLAIGDVARAYPYHVLKRGIIIHDELSGIPLLLHLNPETRSIHIFVRQLNDGKILDFRVAGENLVDNQTGSVWNPTRGLANDGELSGQALRELPWISSYDWAWLDFYPHSDFYSNN